MDYTNPMKTISFPKYYNVEKNFKSTLFSEANGITIPTEHNLKWEKKMDQFVCDVTAFVGNSLKVKRDTQYVFQIPPMRLYLFFKK